MLFLQIQDQLLDYCCNLCGSLIKHLYLLYLCVESFHNLKNLQYKTIDCERGLLNFCDFNFFSNDGVNAEIVLQKSFKKLNGFILNTF